MAGLSMRMMVLLTVLPSCLAANSSRIEESEKALCADTVMHQISTLVGLSNTIVQTSVDCTLPGLDESSCTSDVMGLVGGVLGCTLSTLDLVAACGNLEHSCAHNTIWATQILLGVGVVLVTTVNDCQSDPWLCAYDVVTLVDYINGLAAVILLSIRACQSPGSVEGFFDFPGADGGNAVVDRYIRTEYQGDMLPLKFERRLQEAVAANASLTKMRGKFADYDMAVEKLRVELRRVMDAVTARGQKGNSTAPLDMVSATGSEGTAPNVVHI